jgi:hypothetical protein
MNDFDTQLEGLLGMALEYAGDDFEFRTQPLRGVLSALRAGSDPQSRGGFLDTRSGTVSVRAHDLAVVTNGADPRTLAGEKITLIRGNTRRVFRIASIVEPSAACVDLEITSEDEAF